MVKTGILYRLEIQYTLPGTVKRYVPSPTICTTNLPLLVPPFSASVASLIPSAPPPDQPRPPPPQLIHDPGSVGCTLSCTKPVFVTASIAQMVSSGQRSLSFLL